jgi:hypothetical protein
MKIDGNRACAPGRQKIPSKQVFGAISGCFDGAMWPHQAFWSGAASLNEDLNLCVAVVHGSARGRQ